MIKYKVNIEMKKILILGFVSLLILSCGSNDNDIVKSDLQTI